MSVSRQFTRVVGNLHRQLTGWRQDQDTRRAGFLTRKVQKVLQRRQQKGCGFTCPGGRRTEDITPFKRRRNNSGLDSGWACKAFILERVQKAVVKFEFGKSRYSHVLPLCGALIIDVTAAIFICCLLIAFLTLRFPLCYSGFPF